MKELFEQKLKGCKAGLVSYCEKILIQIEGIISSYHRIQKQLKGKVLLNEVPVLNDVKKQVAELLDKQFIKNSPAEVLGHFPRYLKGNRGSIREV